MPKYADKIGPSGRISIALDREVEAFVNAEHRPKEPFPATVNCLLKRALKEVADG